MIAQSYGGPRLRDTATQQRKPWHSIGRGKCQRKLSRQMQALEHVFMNMNGHTKTGERYKTN